MALPLITATLKTDFRQITALERDQLPFATSLAMNRLVEKMQAGVRDSLSRDFTIAPKVLPFMKLLVRFDRANHATKTKLEARFGVNDTEGLSTQKDRSFILGRHEIGGVRTASPDRPFAIPTGAIRGGDYDVAPRSMYPSSLGFVERRTASGVQPIRGRVTRKGTIQIQGKHRTFIIDARETSDPRAWGIYQRTGPGKRDIEMIWAFRTTITLPPRLHFYEVASAIQVKEWPGTFEEAMDYAVRTAR
jgi:hypothetical protein